MGRLNKEMIIGSFEKNKFIETSFNNEEDFNDAIENLKEANIDFIVTEKRIFYKWLMKGYFLYAVTMDIIILGGIFYLIIFGIRG
tara:strand:- start:126 stop:380 length:255 start_codon:yes stop_codon:yes gene_type:complete